jgi:hypothetical protein
MQAIKIFVMVISVFFVTTTMAQSYYSSDKPVHVQGYTKQDGTHVQGYYRSTPNH